MPAKSASQQRLMGMVYAYKNGELDLSDVDENLQDKVKEIAKGISQEDAKKFVKTKHEGLPKHVNDSWKPTFKEFLVEITQKQRQALVPPPAVQKLYNEIKKQHGVVKRDVFYNKLADRLNLTPKGLKRLQQLPALRALPFDDQSQEEKPTVTQRDPWAHVSQKHTKRAQRAQQGAPEGKRTGRKAGEVSPEKKDLIKRLGG